MAEKEQKPEFRKKRAAKVTSVSELVTGAYVRVENSQDPNYLLTKNGEKISRVNVVGVVVSVIEGKGAETNELVIDDGTGRIPVRFFEGSGFGVFGIGNIINVIGKPREFSGAIFLVPEIVRLIDNPGWAAYRKLSISLKKPATAKTDSVACLSYDEEEEKKELPVDNMGVGGLDVKKIAASKQDIINFIRNNDSGAGVSFSQLKEEFSKQTLEHLEEMQKKGDVFMIKPGYFKVLE